mmetsp:Transcript_40260/g.127309  ORF Transcript_40260/g.127309 Transcript_40260/m.127309 type:complete len:202 (+) Transcript_40260:456-1061(+)
MAVHRAGAHLQLERRARRQRVGGVEGAVPVGLWRRDVVREGDLAPKSARHLPHREAARVVARPPRQSARRLAVLAVPVEHHAESEQIVGSLAAQRDLFEERRRRLESRLDAVRARRQGSSQRRFHPPRRLLELLAPGGRQLTVPRPHGAKRAGEGDGADRLSERRPEPALKACCCGGAVGGGEAAGDEPGPCADRRDEKER